MSIIIGERFKVTCDELNYTLYEQQLAKRGKRAGSMSWKLVGYYPTMAAALKKLSSTVTARSAIGGDLTLEEYVSRCERILENLEAWGKLQHTG